MAHPVEVETEVPTEKVKEVVKTKNGKKVIEKVKTVPAKNQPSKSAVKSSQRRVQRPEVEAKWEDAPNRVVSSSGSGPNFLSKNS